MPESPARPSGEWTRQLDGSPLPLKKSLARHVSSNRSVLIEVNSRLTHHHRRDSSLESLESSCSAFFDDDDDDAVSYYCSCSCSRRTLFSGVIGRGAMGAWDDTFRTLLGTPQRVSREQWGSDKSRIKSFDHQLFSTLIRVIIDQGGG